MLLVSLERVRDDLGYTDSPDIDNAFTEALNAAEGALAAALNTVFDPVVGQTELFWAKQPFKRDESMQYTQFRLTRGFVSALTKVSFVKHNPTQFGTGPGNETDITITTALDSDKGLLTDMYTPFHEAFVCAVYNAGFGVDANDATCYDQTAVPDWLQSAALLSAKISLQSHPSLLDANIKLDTTTLQKHLKSLLTQHLRYAPNALMPIRVGPLPTSYPNSYVP